MASAAAATGVVRISASMARSIVAKIMAAYGGGVAAWQRSIKAAWRKYGAKKKKAANNGIKIKKSVAWHGSVISRSVSSAAISIA